MWPLNVSFDFSFFTSIDVKFNVILTQNFDATFADYEWTLSNLKIIHDLVNFPANFDVNCHVNFHCQLPCKLLWKFSYKLSCELHANIKWTFIWSLMEIFMAYVFNFHTNFHAKFCANFHVKCHANCHTNYCANSCKLSCASCLVPTFMWNFIHAWFKDGYIWHKTFLLTFMWTSCSERLYKIPCKHQVS